MSWSIVRTCGRCGVRAELPINDIEDVAVVNLVLRLQFVAGRADLGCPACCPEGANALGIDADVWRAAVARARGLPPS